LIQSVTFGDKNTWDDWHLLATKRPVFQPPAPKTVIVDIPGGNGALDLSTSLTGYPVYANRTGSFEFIVENGYGLWAHRYSDIMQYLHGRAMKAVLFDDPEYFYEGRFSVESWESNITWSTITISYNVGPYKWKFQDSTEPWLWDPFNFDSGVIFPDLFTEIMINSPSAWDARFFPGELFGQAPISPIFMVTGAVDLQVRFINQTLGIDEIMDLHNGANEAPKFIFHGDPTYSMSFKGIGTIDIKFRAGRL